MGKVPVNMRLDEELWAEVGARRGVRSKTGVVEAALRAWLAASPSLVVLASEVESRSRPDLPSVPGVVSGRELAESPARYACPERDCGFVAPSSRATCRVHGRRVVGS